MGQWSTSKRHGPPQPQCPSKSFLTCFQAQSNMCLANQEWSQHEQVKNSRFSAFQKDLKAPPIWKAVAPANLETHLDRGSCKPEASRCRSRNSMSGKHIKVLHGLKVVVPPLKNQNNSTSVRHARKVLAAHPRLGLQSDRSEIESIKTSDFGSKLSRNTIGNSWLRWYHSSRT